MSFYLYCRDAKFHANMDDPIHLMCDLHVPFHNVSTFVGWRDPDPLIKWVLYVNFVGLGTFGRPDSPSHLVVLFKERVSRSRPVGWSSNNKYNWQSLRKTHLSDPTQWKIYDWQTTDPTTTRLTDPLARALERKWVPVSTVKDKQKITIFTEPSDQS